MSDRSPAPSDSPAERPPWPLTALAAWLLPGLGHYLIGYRRRGLILGITILSLFAAGMLIGGIGVVNSERERLWFIGQTLIGPTAPVVDLYRQSLEGRLGHQLDRHAEELRQVEGFGADDARVLVNFLESDEKVPAVRRSLGRVNELGTLYCTLAGVLNLLVILDVVGRSSSAPIHPAPPPDDKPDTDEGRLVTREREQA
ncbi:MAG: DUF6677 family protein [Phycisphaeraceae bacterium]